MLKYLAELELSIEGRAQNAFGLKSNACNHKTCCLFFPPLHAWGHCFPQ